MPTTSVRRIDRLDFLAADLDDRPRELTRVSTSPERTYSIVHVTSGSAVVQRGVDRISVGAGDLLVLADGPRAARAQGAARVVSVRVPHVAAGQHGTSLNAADGAVIRGADPMARAVGNLLAELSGEDDSAPSRRNPARLAEYIVGLIGIVCTDETEPDPRGVLLARAKQYIEEHLGDLDLSPDAIARACNVSTRTLHRLFGAGGGTISGWIRTRRLENCRAELADPRRAAIPVSVIGSRWGLCDAAHLSRLFKSVYGSSPSAYRAAQLDIGLLPPAAHDGGALLIA